MDLLSYGHWGQPLIVLPTSRGRHVEFESFRMTDAIADLIDAGRVKVYCPDAVDWDNWYNNGAHPAHRAHRYLKYLDFIVYDVVPFVRRHCLSDGIRPWLTGTSWGALHASVLALQYPELFPAAICMSGAYDVTPGLGGYFDQNVYFSNPMSIVSGIQPGEYRDRLVRAHNLILICGQGKWEERALHDTHTLHGMLNAKGIPHVLDLWGYDVEHDWPQWRRQLRMYLERMTG